MKNAFLMFSLLGLLAGCTGNGDKADAYGNFETDELTVSAETSGKLLVFNVEEGQVLKAGDLIAVVDTMQLYLKKMQVQASIAAVRKKLPNEAAQLAVFDKRMEKLNTEIIRIGKLVEANAAPSKQLDDLKAELDVTMKQRSATASTLGTQTQGMLAEIDPLKYQLMQIENQLRKSYIYNPINGTVLTTLAKASELTMQGRPMYKIASLDPLTLRAYVSEDMLSQVKIGDKVKVNKDAPDCTMNSSEGTVT
ncbi:MAG: HlyD family efflux transporter periplasmic adaptor subunit, partial [Flavobacteriales bacterium]|nr:HlyD family efflux transporter periplasmic adaptor subunit [Flavobacteriales bacterium]